MTIRLVIADDHEIVRRGIQSTLAGESIEIVGEAADGQQALEKVQELKPDVLLLDVRMPNKDGLSVLEELQGSDLDMKIVMLSSHDNPTYVARSVALGASDYLLKSISRDDLLDSIRRAANGDEPLASSLIKRVRGVMARRRDRADDSIPLTNREMQVLRHVALGLSNREIGSALGISVETVKEHVQNILRKLDVSDRTQAAVWAVRKGLVD